MKKIITILSILLIAISISCKKDFLERTPSNTIPGDRIFSTIDLSQAFVNSMYFDVPGMDFPDNSQIYDNITDESRSFWGFNDIIHGKWYADDNPMEYWPYEAIRKTNLFLQNIDDTNFTDADKSSLKGQVKVLRAKLYFDMIVMYGGVPLITKPQSLTDDLYIKRSSLDTCFNFVVKEFQEAIELLPETYDDVSLDVSKWNKNSAKAFLGRVILFWASPLYNPIGDMARWGIAAEVNKEVINSNIYSLHQDFRRIMLDHNNSEEIFSVQYKFGFREHSWDSSQQPDDRSMGWAVVWSPVQEFVDAFEMKNGKSIEDPTSGFDPLDPWSNRDPRLQNTVIVNGAPFGYTGWPVWLYIGAESTGIYEPYSTVTGYLMRKGGEETNKTYNGGVGSDQPWQEIRYAEVLLNYAEAQNESLSSPDQSIYDAVNRIRQRAGLDPYQLPTGLNKLQMREKIRHERYIELAFERKRYWDLRRWETAVQVMDGKVFHGMYTTKNDDESFTYEVKPLKEDPCVFKEYMYFMPIPQREIEKNPKLEQNPGW